MVETYFTFFKNLNLSFIFKINFFLNYFKTDMSSKENGNKVIVIGASNRPDSLDPSLRRAGRFDKEISLGIPDTLARKEILSILTKSLPLSPDVDLEELAKLTPGYVGADLVALRTEAAMAATNR